MENLNSKIKIKEINTTICETVNWCCEDCPNGKYYEDVTVDEDGEEIKTCYWTCKDKTKIQEGN